MKLAKTLQKLVLARVAVGAYRRVQAVRHQQQSRRRRKTFFFAFSGTALGAALAWLLLGRFYSAPQLELAGLRPPPPPSRKKLRALERRERAERARLDAERAPHTARVHVVMGERDELAVKLGEVVKH